MYKKELEYIKNKELEKWMDEINEQITELNNNLAIASFINGMNKLEKKLKENPILREKEIKLHIDGLYDSEEGVVEAKAYFKQIVNNKNLYVNEIEIGQELFTQIRKIISELPEMAQLQKTGLGVPLDKSYKIELDNPIKEIKEELSKIFLSEKNRIKYNHLLMSSDLSSNEILDNNKRKHKI